MRSARPVPSSLRPIHAAQDELAPMREARAAGRDHRDVSDRASAVHRRLHVLEEEPAGAESRPRAYILERVPARDHRIGAHEARDDELFPHGPLDAQLGNLEASGQECRWDEALDLAP
jgi:hypothetical protein